MTRPVLALLVSLALSSAPLAAQPSRVRLAVGARVRVATPPRVGWVAGTVVLADSERVVLRGPAPAAPDTFDVAALQALEVSRGRRRLVHGVVGVFIGGAVGSVAGALVGKYTDPGYGDEPLYIAAGAVIGLAGGALLGGTLGALTAPERWDQVRVQ